MLNRTACNVLNICQPEKFGAVCGDAATEIIVKDGPKHVCWTHARAHEAGRDLRFSDGAPALAEAPRETTHVA